MLIDFFFARLHFQHSSVRFQFAFITKMYECLSRSDQMALSDYDADDDGYDDAAVFAHRFTQLCAMICTHSTLITHFCYDAYNNTRACVSKYKKNMKSHRRCVHNLSSFAVFFSFSSTHLRRFQNFSFSIRARINVCVHLMLTLVCLYASPCQKLSARMHFMLQRIHLLLEWRWVNGMHAESSQKKRTTQWKGYAVAIFLLALFCSVLFNDHNKTCRRCALHFVDYFA